MKIRIYDSFMQQFKTGTCFMMATSETTKINKKKNYQKIMA